MSNSTAAPPDSSTWMNALADFLMEEPAVESIRLNPDSKRVEMATLGRVDGELLQAKLSEVLRAVDAKWLKQNGQVPPSNGMLDVQQKEDGAFVLEKPSCPTAPKFWQWRDFAWPEPDEMEQESDNEWRTLALQAGICAVALAAGFITERFFSAPTWLAKSLFAISLIAGGWDAVKDTWENLRERRLDVHFLMLAVATGAVSIGAWEEGALLLFLFSTSGALEHFVMFRTHREINALTKAAPKFAHVLQPDGTTADRGVETLQVGDVIVVKPDELFAVDGTVIEGSTAADESTLTGEAVPIAKEKGAPIYGGTLNQWGLVQVRVDRLVTQSALAKIITMIQTAQHLRAPSQRFTDRFGTRYTLLTLRVVAGFWHSAAGKHGNVEVVVLPCHDAAGGDEPLRAGAFDPFGHSGGDCLGCAAWGAVPWWCCH
jgi:Cd2+/Zn2+-exporting ATPase